MERNKAFEALKLRVENMDIIKHSLAVEAIMRSLAEYFHDDVDLWGIAGLVHDIDFERINGNLELHGLMAGDILEGLDFDETIVYAVKAHNPANQLARRRRIDKALYGASPMARLIMTCALTQPGRKLNSINEEFVYKCFKDDNFEPDISRGKISECLEIDLSIEEFVHISLEALKSISDSIGM